MMADGIEVPFKAVVKFGVRNDKSRGILIETMETVAGNVYLFKFHDQPLNRHCQQVQNIVKAQNVQRARKILIDVSEFMCEYFRPMPGNRFAAEFRANRLDSTKDQVEKVYKQAKIVARNDRILANISAAETAFQNERARRISNLFDEAQRRYQGGAHSGGAHNGGAQNGGAHNGGAHNGGGQNGGAQNGGAQNGGNQHVGNQHVVNQQVGTAQHGGFQDIAAQTGTLPQGDQSAGGVQSILYQAGGFQVGEFQADGSSVEQVGDDYANIALPEDTDMEE